MSKLTHLTATGQHAGWPYCGAARGADNGIHLLSAYQHGVADPQAYIDKHVTCMACRKAYAAAGSDQTNFGPVPLQETLF